MRLLRNHHRRRLDANPVKRHRFSTVACHAIQRDRTRSGAHTLIKICGIMSPEDALTALDAGADFIGMIMWQKAKRSVSLQTAREIASLTHSKGAVAVGVFVDESAESIATACQQSGITVAQLHGDGARSALDGIPPELQVVYVLNSHPDGTIHTPLPQHLTAQQGEAVHGRPVDWLLVDGMVGGSGQALDWTRLQAPAGAASGWLLAGGLKPENVATAVKLARPTAVDVSSGVCGPDGLRKDPLKIRAFIEAVKSVPAADA